MSAKTAARFHAFSNGSEYAMWAEDNCWNCRRFNFDGPSECAMERTFWESEHGIPMWAARRIGIETVTFQPGHPLRVLGKCKERLDPDSGDDPLRYPVPDAPGQRFLWSDLFWERGDEDRAVLEEVRDAVR